MVFEFSNRVSVYCWGLLLVVSFDIHLLMSLGLLHNNGCCQFCDNRKVSGSWGFLMSSVY